MQPERYVQIIATRRMQIMLGTINIVSTYAGQCWATSLFVAPQKNFRRKKDVKIIIMP